MKDHQLGYAPAASPWFHAGCECCVPDYPCGMPDRIHVERRMHEWHCGLLMPLELLRIAAGGKLTLDDQRGIVKRAHDLGVDIARDMDGHWLAERVPDDKLVLAQADAYKRYDPVVDPKIVEADAHACEQERRWRDCSLPVHQLGLCLR